MTQEKQQQQQQGSWIPTMLIIAIFLLKWIMTSPNNKAVTIRRMIQMKKLQLKKQLGLRDESKYKMGAGDGANLKHKRQG